MSLAPASSRGGAGFDQSSSWITVANTSTQGPFTADGTQYNLSFPTLVDHAGTDLAKHAADNTKIDILAAGRYQGVVIISAAFTGTGSTAGTLGVFPSVVFDLNVQALVVLIASGTVILTVPIDPQTVVSVPQSLQIIIQPQLDGTSPVCTVNSCELILQRIA